MKRRWTDTQLIDAVVNSGSYAEILRQIGLIPAGGNHQQIKKHIRRLKLDTSHLTGQAWNKGLTLGPQPREPLEDVLIEGRLVSSSAETIN